VDEYEEVRQRVQIGLGRAVIDVDDVEAVLVGRWLTTREYMADLLGIRERIVDEDGVALWNKSFRIVRRGLLKELFRGVNVFDWVGPEDRRKVVMRLWKKKAVAVACGVLSSGRIEDDMPVGVKGVGMAYRYLLEHFGEVLAERRGKEKELWLKLSSGTVERVRREVQECAAYVHMGDFEVLNDDE
jgi:hypothetical protein